MSNVVLCVSRLYKLVVWFCVMVHSALKMSFAPCRRWLTSACDRNSNLTLGMEDENDLGNDVILLSSASANPKFTINEW